MLINEQIYLSFITVILFIEVVAVEAKVKIKIKIKFGSNHQSVKFTEFVGI